MQLYDDHTATMNTLNLDVNMTVNNFAMQEHQYGYLPLQDDEHDAIKMDSNASDAGDGYITLVNDANETQNDIIQPNSSYNLNETMHYQVV